MRQTSEEECEAHVVGLVLAQMYSLRKGTELFGEKTEEATMTELSQIDDFESYFCPFTSMILANKTEGTRLNP